MKILITLVFLSMIGCVFISAYRPENDPEFKQLLENAALIEKKCDTAEIAVVKKWQAKSSPKIAEMVFDLDDARMFIDYIKKDLSEVLKKIENPKRLLETMSIALNSFHARLKRIEEDLR